MIFARITFIVLLLLVSAVTIIITPAVEGSPFLFGYLVFGIIIRLIYAHAGWERFHAILIFEIIGLLRIVFGVINGMHEFTNLLFLMIFELFIFFYDPKNNMTGTGRGKKTGSSAGCGGCGSGCSSGCGGGCGGCGGD